MIFMEAITKQYLLGEVRVPVLKGINLCIKEGEYVAIMGASGSGKSTLMNIIGCLDRPTTGQYALEGRNLMNLDNDELAYIRNYRIGFIFQQFNLLPRSTALENVMLPMIYSHVPKLKRRQRAIDALTQVGLANYLNNRPSQLSGGQQQRVAVARALANRPALVLADEPTGALDSETSQELMNLLTQLNQQGITIVIVTHDLDIANQTQRIIRLQDGLIISETVLEKVSQSKPIVTN
ncbi:ABC transporter ATP-binding protein [Anabaena sp. FACHB-1237]|uniref:ABC transporter ATP-binding protein n=1 Tax=Anabaena sp. FACHB-1237 TaxID=2692769 RepID=UPI001680B40E|nr:ABC transporter ATP-binding protein [Anabaena sp. FACHB-1237]MBD2138452.1 ABC transporter ATP-binding protein [Anabaena sp. FACHB-1237]